MRKLITFIASALLSASSHATPALPAPVILTPQNTLSLFGPVNEDMVETVARTLPRLGPIVYVNILSGGGSIHAGKRIIDQLVAIQSQGKQVVCIPHMAISMAFVILQSPACPVRLAVPSSILMQHQASVAVDGPLNNLRNLLDAIHVEIGEIEKMQADRLKMNVGQFRQLTGFDWWLNSGTVAVRHNAADSIGNVLCSPSLIKRKVIKEIQFWGTTIKIESSECPYILRQKLVLPERKSTKPTVNIYF